eukprot:TRINITY_DN4960_c0_g1_i2.p2 TRINITY_DN4960_c0_g1~~TRINITY_DN4960_c0_g1_i2.p2  ORF type:complete len:135 (-),score=9.83 TRINITY_DN4960_c0_g1_i2:62-466(-)
MECGEEASPKPNAWTFGWSALSPPNMLPKTPMSASKSCSPSAPPAASSFTNATDLALACIGAQEEEKSTARMGLKYLSEGPEYLNSSTTSSRDSIFEGSFAFLFCEDINLILSLCPGPSEQRQQPMHKILWVVF